MSGRVSRSPVVKTGHTSRWYPCTILTEALQVEREASCNPVLSLSSVNLLLRTPIVFSGHGDRPYLSPDQISPQSGRSREQLFMENLTSKLTKKRSRTQNLHNCPQILPLSVPFSPGWSSTIATRKKKTIAPGDARRHGSKNILRKFVNK